MANCRHPERKGRKSTPESAHASTAQQESEGAMLDRFARPSVLTGDQFWLLGSHTRAYLPATAARHLVVCCEFRQPSLPSRNSVSLVFTTILMAQALLPNTSCPTAGFCRRPAPPSSFGAGPLPVSPGHRCRRPSHTGGQLVCAATGAGGSGAAAVGSLSALSHQVETAPDEVQWNRATVVENRWVAHVAPTW